MNLKSILLLATLGAGASTQAQTSSWVNDTVITTQSYRNNVYYSFANGIAKESHAKGWHIALSKSTRSAAIFSNSADEGVKVYELAGVAKDSFGTDLTQAAVESITATPLSLYNSLQSWEVGAFNRNTGSNPFDFGWGVYDQQDHWVYGEKVYALITGADTFQIFFNEKQTANVSNAPIYDFSFAKIDGTNVVNKTVELGGATYGTQNFVYYNLLTDSLYSREPNSENWDILFTNYNDSLTASMWYGVFGVLNNVNTFVTRVDTSSAEISNLDYAQYTYTNSNINNIGRAWKAASQAGVVVYDSITYFAKVQNGDIWQLQFTKHISGTDTTANSGLVAFQKRKVYTAPDTNVSVNNININLNNVVLAPNPAENGTTNLLIDVKNNTEKATIYVTDITGKTVAVRHTALKAGLNALPIQVATYPSGIYMVNVQIAGENKTQKLIIQ